MRVVIAADGLLLREGLARLLVDAEFDVVAGVGDAEALLAATARHRPDVAVIDIRMPTHTDEGLRAARLVRQRYPETGVLVLSQNVRLSHTMDLLSGGVTGVGYLLKDGVSDVAEFVAAVRRVGEGGSALDPMVIGQLVDRHRRRDDPLAFLTDREREVLALIAEGRTNWAISELLAVTERTVEKHCTAIFGKLGLAAGPRDHRRVLAALRYVGVCGGG